MGQPFSAPNGSHGGGGGSTTIFPGTTIKPDFRKCKDKALMKELLINYINNLKFGSIIKKNSREMNDALDDRIKFLEQEKKNISIEYTIKETDFKIKDAKAKNLQKMATVAKYLFFILFFILVMIIMF